MPTPLPTRLLIPGREAVLGTLALPADAEVRGPLVSCVMVTRGALFPARHAIDCFRRQSYAHRELVIVCDRPGNAVATHVAGLGDPAIRYVETAPATLGELRNTSVAHARGELICQWDDDDLYPRDRIALMAAGLADDRAVACFLERWTMWWPARRWLALSERRIWEGTMLARRDALPVYPALRREEDTAIVRLMRARHALRLIDQPLGYCYIVHGGNACNTEHFEGLFARATQRSAVAAYDGDLARLGELAPVADYAAGLDGMRATDP